jgi:hypothetical protein
MNREGMQDRVWIDTETLGLDVGAPVWEFGAVRREVTVINDGFNGHKDVDTRVQILIQHDPAKWLDDADYPQSFKDDYAARYDPALAVPEREAAEIIAVYTAGAVVHASNPAFDMERLAILLARNGIERTWHYHPIDVPTLAQGWLAAKGRLPDPPWKSDSLSLAVGVDPAKYARHTALGDVEWTVDLYDRIMGVYA